MYMYETEWEIGLVGLYVIFYVYYLSFYFLGHCYLIFAPVFPFPCYFTALYLSHPLSLLFLVTSMLTFFVPGCVYFCLQREIEIQTYRQTDRQTDTETEKT